MARNDLSNDCNRCGAKPGRPCDLAKHDERADEPQRRGIDLCACTHFAAMHVDDAGSCSRLGCLCIRFTPHPQPEAISVSLANWNAHQRGCGVCTNAATSTGLCLAGAVLWQRAGLEVVPVPESPHDLKHPRHMRTSELMRRVARNSLGIGTDEHSFSAAEELRRRADYVERLGGHDMGGATCTGCGEVMP
jgi:hypothetical protein